MSTTNLIQPGVLSNPTPHVEFMTFVLTQEKVDSSQVSKAISMISNIAKSIGQKDDTAQLTITTGFSEKAWPILFPNYMKPSELKTFQERKNGPRHFPSTPGDIFFMIKSTRMDLNFQAAKYLRKEFSSFANLIDDIQGYKYLDDRDMIDFVDGTENPKDDIRYQAVIFQKAPYDGGSFLTIQKYIGKESDWESLKTEDQENVIGRSKMDDIEQDDKVKKPYAHNVKSKVIIDGVERKMLRQNRPFGNAMEHGTYFVGFVADPLVMNTALDQMITADAQGHYDKILDFFTCVAGCNYFVPPQSFLDTIAG